MSPTASQLRDFGLGTAGAAAAAALAVLVITSVTGFHAEQNLAKQAIAGRDLTSNHAFTRVNELLAGQKHLSHEIQHVQADNARLRTEVRALVAQLKQTGAVPVISPASTHTGSSSTTTRHVVVTHSHRTVTKRTPQPHRTPTPAPKPTPTPTPSCKLTVLGQCLS